MAVKKIAISLPQSVLEHVDQLARNTQTTRSGFITRVLTEVSNARSQAELTSRINALFSDPVVVDEQASTSAAYLAAEPSADEAPEW